MTPSDRAAVIAIARPVEFALNDVFAEPERRLRNLYFVLDGLISSVVEMADGRRVEITMAGYEGLSSPTAAFLPISAFALEVGQIPGRALQIDAERLRTLTAQRSELAAVIADYIVSQQQETAQSVGCAALHRAEQRLAKWLLRCHDRARRADLPLTQEYLAAMVGSQRTTINEVMGRLAAQGAIRHARGLVTILDRAALERVACECYRRLTEPAADAPADHRILVGSGLDTGHDRHDAPRPARLSRP